MTSLRHKFIFIVGGVTLLAMLAGASALIFITHVDTATDSTLPRTYRVIEATDAAGDAARMLDAAARVLIQSVDSQAARDIDHYDTVFQISLHQAKNEIPRPFTRKEALHARRLAEQYTIYIALLRDMTDPTTNQNTRHALYEQQAAPLYCLISSDAERLKSLARERIDQLLGDAQEASRQTRRRTTLLLLCTAGVCLLSVFFFDRSVLRPVRRIRKLALEIKDGNLEARADIKPTGKRRDEIAQLAEAFNEMAHARSLAEGELKLTAEALRASDSLNRTIIASTSDMVVALDTNSRIILQNEALVRQAATLTGITPEVGQHLPSLLAKHPQAQKWAEAMWSRALAGEHFRITQEVRIPEAEPRYYDFHFDALYDEHGVIIGALQTGRDVTEHHRMERELREAATDLDRRVRERTAELMGLMESIPAVVWIARDPLCRIISGNRAAHDFLGMTPGRNLTLTPGNEPPPAHFKVFSHGVELPPQELPMQKAAANGIEVRDVELEMRFEDGRVRFLFGNASPLRDESGQVTGVIGAFVDITYRKALERDLCAAKEAAEQASQAKSRFLADVSHEIRTPMNAVIGIADVLTRTSLSDDQLEYVRTMREAAGHLLDLLNDILDLSKIEADKLDLQEADFDPGQVIESVIKTFSLAAREKGIGLTMGQAPGTPALVHGDARRLRQILSNLVGNAVKFTDEGGVILSFTRDAPLPGDDEKTVRLRFSVRDTGIGMSREMLPHIFDDFTQAHPERGEKCGGTGLGLAISRKLARKLGGDITAESQPGQGSVLTARATFRMAAPENLRMPAPEAVRSKAFPAPRPQPGRILLVEDNPVNVKVAELHLKKMGHAVTVAATGPQALDFLTREPFDVVLMDVELPGMDGIEVTRRIRSGEAGPKRAQTPIVAMTAHVLDNIRQRCIATGMNDYVAKPVNFFELEALIEHLLAQRFPATGSAKPGDIPPLLFDKDLAMRRLGIDTDTFAPIFQAAVDEFRERLDDLLRAMQHDDLPQVRTHAHTLKSICGTIGFAAGQTLLEGISESARNNDPKRAREEASKLAGLFSEGLRQVCGN